MTGDAPRTLLPLSPVISGLMREVLPTLAGGGWRWMAVANVLTLSQPAKAGLVA